MSNLNINIGTAALSVGYGGTQSFQTQPVTNTRLALYTLSIRSPGQANQAIATYTFPLSPSSVRKEWTALGNTYLVAGTPQQLGAQRIADTYGNSPPTWTIEGTTGWQFHATDGGQLTGVQSILQLQSVLNQYAQLNAQQASQNQPPYILEFYDYFAGDFFQVQPVGPQLIQQTSDRPLLFHYRFQLPGIKNLSGPPQASGVDPIMQALQTPPSQAQGNLSASIGISLSAYL